MALTYMYITNNLDVALIAERNGVQRIWIDLETLGKAERQHNMDTVKSSHSIEDISRIKPMLSTSEVMVRINPWNEASISEIDAVVSAGADIIMLPMWKSVDEVHKFITAVKGRAKTYLLLETKEAEGILDEVLNFNGIDEIHIGLNDLHLSYGLTFMFELLSNGTVERICNKIKKKGIPYGFGGIARLGDGMLPAENIVMEHYRMGSTRAILSRSFCNTEKIKNLDDINCIFSKNMKALREYELFVSTATEEMFENNRIQVAAGVDKIVQSIKKRGGKNEHFN